MTAADQSRSDALDGEAKFASSARNPHVVILDDEPFIHSLLLGCIHGWSRRTNVSCCLDGGSAGRILESQDPDLFVTDVIHPGRPTEELLSIQLQKPRRYPVILCTGFNRNEELKQYARRHGIFLMELIKPFSPATFWDMLNELFGSAQYPCFDAPRAVGLMKGIALKQ